MKRFNRQDDIERKLAHSPGGLSITYLARLYDVDRSTIYRDLGELQSRGAGLVQDGHRWKLDHRRVLYSTRFTPYELVALYLAARLLSRYSDEQNPHVVKALEKLADALERHSPLVTNQILQAAKAVSERPADPEYTHAFEVITQAWLSGRKARVTYRGYTGDQTTTRLFSPYFIEPSAMGFSCYIIGHDDLRGKMRTLKLERIQDAVLTDEVFPRPDDFDPYQLLATAWGIMWQEDNPQEVRFRFSSRVMRRVKESVWHPSQDIAELPDGSCIYTVLIGSLTEIKPWIRQWGADVEALAPPALRDELAAEARALATLYSTTTP